MKMKITSKDEKVLLLVCLSLPCDCSLRVAIILSQPYGYVNQSCLQTGGVHFMSIYFHLNDEGTGKLYHQPVVSGGEIAAGCYISEMTRNQGKRGNIPR